MFRYSFRRMAKKCGVAGLAAALFVGGLPALPTAEAAPATAGVSRADPGFTYGPAARDWVTSADYYYVENDHVKFTVGTMRLDTNDPVDYSPDKTGNDKWGSLAKGAMMDAAPKPSMRDNLDYTEFVLREQMGWTWWYPGEKLEMGSIAVDQDRIVASGNWDKNDLIQSSIVYSAVENTPLVKMELTITNATYGDYNGYFGYFFDSDESAEQHSYVPGWGWRTAQAKQIVQSGWTKNYIFNGVKDRFTGNPAHAVIWPQSNVPAALVPEGYIQGVWFDANIQAGASKTYTFYHLPHIAGPAETPYIQAEYWADRIWQGQDVSALAGMITGAVTDDQGAGVSNAKVSVKNMSGTTVAEAVTNTSGFYQLYVDRGMSYKVEAAKAGYIHIPAVGYADLLANAGTVMNLQLVPSGMIPELPDAVDAAAGVAQGDPGFTYGKAARDWAPGVDYYYLENDEAKITIGTVRLDTGHPTDYGDAATGNNRWGTLTPGHIMDAAPKHNMHDNLDYTQFVLRTEPARTWWYPAEKLSMPNIRTEDHTVVASGQWDKESQIKSEVTYSLVEHSPLVKMKVKLTNEGASPFTGHLAYLLDSDEQLEQQSYVPGWGWRGGEVGNFITSGWNQNYLFNGIRDKYTGNTAHAVIWPEHQPPSAIIPEGYITGAWFDVGMAPGGTKELILYYLPHDPGPAYEAYQTAEFWADRVKYGTDPQTILHVTGEAADSQGRPAAGIELSLLSGTGEVIARAATDERGAYSLYALKGQPYTLRATNGVDSSELPVPNPAAAGDPAVVDFELAAVVKTVNAGVTNGDPGFTYEGTSRDWWPAYDYYYLESPEVKMTVGTVRTATHHPTNWTNDASGNNKWGSLTPGHMMDAVPKLTMQENLDFSVFTLSDDLGVTPEDDANGKYMEWSWFHPLTMLQLPDIAIDGNSIVAQGDWYQDTEMKADVRYSIVEGTPLIRMDITLDNQTGADFDGDFGYIIDSDQPGEQHSYLPGRNWVYAQESNGIKSGWTDNYLFSGIDNTFSGKTAHAIIWPDDQQPSIVIHEGIFNGVWFPANIPNGQSASYTVYHMPHVGGPTDKPYAVAEFWANVIKEGGDPQDYGVIAGTVTDDAGNPVAFTEMVAEEANGEVYARAVTNGEGKYQLFVERGTYELYPVHEQYSTDSQTPNLMQTRRVQADFVMHKYADVVIELPSAIAVDVPFDVKVKVTNLTDSAMQQIKVDVQPPYFVYMLDEAAVTIPSVAAGAQAEVTARAVALDGGRSSIRAQAYTDAFRAVAKKSFDVSGEGYYGGDNHTHTKHSDGVNTIAENADSVYNKRLLSWVWSTEHNMSSHLQDAANVTQSYNGRFLSLAGFEITTSQGHALAYGVDSMPRFTINDTDFTWQDSIDEVVGQGGLIYIAHPFEQTYAFRTPYVWTGFTGVEVWNGSRHALDNSVNSRAFQFWDEINIRGDGKYFGLANTDGHTKDKVGDTYIKGLTSGLTGQNVLELLRTGAFFGTNGPEVRFSVDGVDMGGTLAIEQARTARFDIQAYDPNSNLTLIQLIKYPVTGDIADYDQREIVFEADLTQQQTNTFIDTITLPVADGEFYRLEVRSEKANENSSGIGPLAGTGFAFTNPVWIELDEASNAKLIESVTYAGAAPAAVEEQFGYSLVRVDAEQLVPQQIAATAAAGVDVDIDYIEIDEDDRAGIVLVTLTAADGSSKTHKYVWKAVPGQEQEPGEGEGPGEGGDPGTGENPGSGGAPGTGNEQGAGSGGQQQTDEAMSIAIRGADGQQLEQSIRMEVAEAGTRKATTVMLDAADGLQQLVSQAGQQAAITIPVLNQSDSIVLQADGSLLEQLQAQDAELVIVTEDVIYTLPAAAIDLEGLMAEASSEPLTIRIGIAHSTRGTDGFSFVAPPVEFSIKAAYGSRTVEVGNLQAYVKRAIAIPESADASSVTTGVIVKAGGDMRHLPTAIAEIDGRTYAVISSLIVNGTVALIARSEPVADTEPFADVQDHWAGPVIGDMAARLIVDGSGDGLFTPDGEITRAEFAAMITRALGLYDEQYRGTFNDVQSADWFSNAVSNAYVHGLIQGYDDGGFRPSEQITREEAIAIIARAIALAGGADAASNQGEASLPDRFADYRQLGEWALPAVALAAEYGIIEGDERQQLLPKSSLTRAQSAAIAARLLQALKFI